MRRPDQLPSDIEWPSDEEDAAITRAAAEDPDNPELTDDQLAQMRPMREMLAKLVRAQATLTRGRGPQRAPTKCQVTMRLDQDVVAALRASGPGWSVRANAALRAAILPNP